MDSAIRGVDIVVLLALVATGDDRDSARAHLGLPVRSWNASLRRCAQSELYAPLAGRVRRGDLKEFLLHGIRHVFPGRYGDREVFGVPTSLSADPLRQHFVVPPEAAVVWRHRGGTVRGLPLEPLSPSLPSRALRWPELHRLAAVVDAVRAGRSREREAASAEIGRLLAP